jgi:adenine specific DNA methylase Mod
MFDLDAQGRQLKAWTNKLIWGDNKLILSSFASRAATGWDRARGGLKLIYIDPSFDVGADFSMDIEIGDDTFTKNPGILEEIAYRDTWGKGTDLFIVMIYERLSLMRELLADDGSLFVHCDWRLNAPIRMILDETFGPACFKNEIVWCYRDLGGGRNTPFYKRKDDNIYWYSKREDCQICEIARGKLSEETLKVYGRHFIKNAF